MSIAVYPGSFDGDQWSYRYSGKKQSAFDKVIIAVVHNVTKKALFTLDERVALIKEVLGIWIMWKWIVLVDC